jgi:diguanylate cyclase with GGDEF domain
MHGRARALKIRARPVDERDMGTEPATAGRGPIEGQPPEAALGWAIHDGADEIADGVRARLEVVGLDRREPGAHVYQAIAETDRLAARVLGRWLATEQEITPDEGRALSALGDLVGEVCLPGIVKAYLAFRDVADELIERESERMGIPDEIRDQALSMMSLCTDGCLVTMCRRFDDERIRLAGELVAEQAKLEHLALHDPLTGLANRALFKQELEAALVAAPEAGAVGVLFADLDRFKSVNDTLGHDAGDRLLSRSPTASAGSCARTTPWRASAATSS